MPFDGSTYDPTAQADLEIMRKALKSMSHRRAWARGFDGADGAHCIVGWLSIGAGKDHSTDDEGFRIAAERIFPELPEKYRHGDNLRPRVRAWCVINYNDFTVWFAHHRVKRLLKRAIQRLEECEQLKLVQ